MAAFTKTIVQVGIFMLCAQVLLHLRPDSSYEKYMKMLVSIMILVQISGPVINLFTRDRDGIEKRVTWFEEQIRESMEKAQEAARETDRLLGQMTLEQIRELLKEQAKQEEAAHKKPGNPIGKIEIKIGTDNATGTGE